MYLVVDPIGAYRTTPWNWMSLAGAWEPDLGPV